MNRRRFIAALGALGITRGLPADALPSSRQEFVCTSELERGVVPNLVAAKVRVHGPGEQAMASGFLQFVSEPVSSQNACRLLDDELLYQRWNPHLVSNGVLPQLEQLVTDSDRLRFELNFQSLSGEKENIWRKRGSLGVTVDEAKLFLPAALLEPSALGPFHFVISSQGETLEVLEAESRGVSFKDGSIDGLREFYWWQKQNSSTHRLVERIGLHKRLDVSLCDKTMMPLLSFHLNLESLGVVKTWLVNSVDFMAKKHRKRECVPLISESDCFLTTATVGALGLSDECWELRALRRFRDRTLLLTAEGRRLVSDYYSFAPLIVERVNQRPDALELWRKTYLFGILPSAALARLNLTRLAVAWYKVMTRRLARAALLAQT